MPNNTILVVSSAACVFIGARRLRARLYAELRRSPYRPHQHARMRRPVSNPCYAADAGVDSLGEMFFTQCTVSDNNAADGVTPVTCDTQANDMRVYGGSTGAPAWEVINGVASIRGINTIAHEDANGAPGNFLTQLTTQRVDDAISWATSERDVGGRTRRPSVRRQGGRQQRYPPVELGAWASPPSPRVPLSHVSSWWQPATRRGTALPVSPGQPASARHASPDSCWAPAASAQKVRVWLDPAASQVLARTLAMQHVQVEDMAQQQVAAASSSNSVQQHQHQQCSCTLSHARRPRLHLLRFTMLQLLLPPHTA